MLTEKLELGVMKAIEFKPKERLVTQAVGLPQEGGVRRGKGGVTSKRWPHSRHSHLGTSVTKNTGLSPMGTVCSSRNRRPFRLTSRLPHSGQTSNSGLTNKKNRTHPSPYAVRQYS